jgi:hypothetical protein
MKVSVITTTQGASIVHAAGCADIKRDAKAHGETKPWEIEVADETALAKALWSDIAGDTTVKGTPEHEALCLEFLHSDDLKPCVSFEAQPVAPAYGVTRYSSTTRHLLKEDREVAVTLCTGGEVKTVARAGEVAGLKDCARCMKLTGAKAPGAPAPVTEDQIDWADEHNRLVRVSRPTETKMVEVPGLGVQVEVTSTVPQKAAPAKAKAPKATPKAAAGTVKAKAEKVAEGTEGTELASAVVTPAAAPEVKPARRGRKPLNQITADDLYGFVKLEHERGLISKSMHTSHRCVVKRVGESYGVLAEVNFAEHDLADLTISFTKANPALSASAQTGYPKELDKVINRYRAYKGNVKAWNDAHPAK